MQLQQVAEVKSEQANGRYIPDKLVKSNLIWNEKAKNAKLKRCSLVRIGPNQYFGDYEIFKKSNRITKAVCHSNSEIFILDKKEFFENMQFIKLVEEIHNLFKERELWYQGMIQKNIKAESQMANQNQMPRYSVQLQEEAQNNNKQEQNFGNSQHKEDKYKQLSSGNTNKKEDIHQQQDTLHTLDRNQYNKEIKPTGQLNQEQLNGHQKFKNQRQQMKIMDEETAMDNIIKLKQFIGKSMNLMQQIESAKRTKVPNQASFRSSDRTITEPNKQTQRRNEQASYTSIQDSSIPSLQALDESQPNLRKHNFNSVQNIPFQNKQSLGSKLNLQIRHSLSKSEQILPIIKDTPTNNSSFQNLYNQEMNSAHNQFNNQIQDKNLLSIKNNVSHNRQSYTESNTPSANTPKEAAQLYQLNTPTNQSQQYSQMKKQSKFNPRGSLQEIDNVVHELERSVVQTKKIEKLSDDNFDFIKNQIELNKKSLLKQKNELSFSHKYLCEKTGRYKIPSFAQIQEDKREHKQFNSKTAKSMKDLTDRELLLSQRSMLFSIFRKTYIQYFFYQNKQDDTDSSLLLKEYQNNKSQFSQKSILPLIVSPRLMINDFNPTKSLKKTSKIQQEFLEDKK